MMPLPHNRLPDDAQEEKLLKRHGLEVEKRPFGGNAGSTPQGGKQAKTKTLRNPQSFNYEVSHLRGHATLSRGHLAVN